MAQQWSGMARSCHYLQGAGALAGTQVIDYTMVFRGTP
jgi:hypothetical protein